MLSKWKINEVFKSFKSDSPFAGGICCSGCFSVSKKKCLEMPIFKFIASVILNWRHLPSDGACCRFSKYACIKKGNRWLNTLFLLVMSKIHINMNENYSNWPWRLNLWLIFSSVTFLNTSASVSLAKFKPTWQSWDTIKVKKKNQFKT